MIGFVDYTSGTTNDFLLPAAASIEHYVEMAQHDSQRWSDTLALSGGALEDTKCSYHYMRYEFTAGGLPVLKGGQFGPWIRIRAPGNSEAIPMKQLAAHTPHKTLGMIKSPYRGHALAFAHIRKKHETHCKVIVRSPLTRRDTWSYYHAIYLQSVCYPFPSCPMPSRQATVLQKQIKQAVLPKYGFNQNTPNAEMS